MNKINATKFVISVKGDDQSPEQIPVPVRPAGQFAPAARRNDSPPAKITSDEFSQLMLSPHAKELVEPARERK
jgi:hypothetical protein